VSKLVSGGVIGVVIVLTALISGCGSGGDTSTAALTKSQFLQQGNAICEKGEVERLQAMEGEYASLSSGGLSEAEVQEKLLTVSLVAYDKTVSRLSELEAPEGEEKNVEELIQAMEGASQAASAHPREALQGGVTFRKANKLLNDYGLDKCDLIGA
jgi:hypothetical protein